MNSAWALLHAILARTRWASQVGTAKEIHGLKRVDCTLLALLLALAIATVSISFAVILGHQKYGWFNNAPFSPVVDERLLTNLRSPERSSVFADMAFDGVTESLFVARRDGLVHRLHIPTLLWSEESLRVQAGSISSDIIALRADCTSQVHLPPCESSGLWALTKEGGLASRGPDGWRAIISDVEWTGLTGVPVEQKNLRSVAISEDGRWVLLGTDGDGVGLFDTRDNHWISLNASEQRTLLGQAGREIVSVNKVLWAIDRFWIAGSTGLAWIDPSEEHPKLVSEDSVHGTVLDLDRGQNGEVLVLSEGDCLVSGPKCFAVQRIQRPGVAELLIGEQERNPKLSGSTVRYVAIQGTSTITFGSAGIHRYDSVSRSWQEIEPSPANFVLETFMADATYAAIPGAVIRISSGSVTERWKLPNQRIEHLLFSKEGQLIAVSRDETIYKLTSGSSVQELRSRTISAFDIQDARTAARYRDTLVLVGENGALLHDVRTRRYDFVSAPQVPKSLLQSGAKLHSSENEGIWVEGGTQTVAHIRIQPNAANLPTLVEFTHDFASRIDRFQPDLKGAYAILEGGKPNRLEWNRNQLSEVALTGTPRPKDMLSPITAEVMSDGSVLFADSNALWLYDFSKRGWSPRRNSELDGQDLIDFTVEEGSLYTVGVDGLLVKIDGTQAKTLLGHGKKFPFGQSALDDATIDGSGRLHLAGAGHIVAYNPIERKILNEWSPPGTGTFELAGTVAGEPLGLRGDVVFLGNTNLTLPNAKAVSVSLGADEIVTLQERGGERFLALFPRQNGVGPSDARCFFGDEAPPQPSIRDAVQLGDGGIAAITGEQIALYEPDNRRWRKTNWHVSDKVDRLWQFGDWIAATGDTVLMTVKASDMRGPDSCSDALIKVSGNIRSAFQISVQPDIDQALLLSEGGEVTRWHEGETKAVLPKSTGGPVSQDLIRVYADGVHAMFLSRKAAWWYDSQLRQWARTSFTNVNKAEVETADATRLGDGRFAITVWTEDGRSLSGIAQRGTAQITLSLMQGLPLPPVPWDFTFFLDAAQMEGKWYFLFTDRLAVLEPGKAQWHANLKFPVARRERRLFSANGLLAIEEMSEGKPSGIYIFPTELRTEGEAGVIDHAAFIDLTRIRDLAVVQGNVKKQHFLLLIGQDGVARECDILPGTLDLSTCSQQSSPPVPMAKEGLFGAYRISKNTLLLRSDGIFLLDREARHLTSIPERFEKFNLLKAHVYEVADDIWLHLAEGAVWRISRSGATREVTSGVTSIYGSGQEGPPVWLAFSDGRLRGATSAGVVLSPTQILDPYGKIGLGGEKFYALSRGHTWVTAINSQGLIVQRGGDKILENDVLTLPNAPPLEAPLAVIPDSLVVDNQNHQGFWIQDGLRLYFIYRELCSVRQTPHGTGIHIRKTEETTGSEELGTIACANSLVEIDLAATGNIPLQVIRDVRFVSTTQINFLTDVGRYESRDGNLTYLHTGRSPFRGMPLAFNETEQVRSGISDLIPGDPRLDIPSIAQIGDEVRLTFIPRLFRDFPGEIRRLALPPLRSSWLSWQRDIGQFGIGDPSDPVMVTPKSLVDGGRFLPDVPGRFYRLTEDSIIGINRNGHWRYQETGSGRVLAPSYRATSFSGSFGLAHGRLLLLDGSVPVEGGAQATDLNTSTVSLWDLQLSDDWRGQSVQAEIPVGGRFNDAFGSTGFAFDLRLSAAWLGTKGVLLTELGVISVDRISMVAPLPQLETDVRLHSIGTSLYARSRLGQWRVLEPAGDWVAVNDPSQNWTMARTAQRTWLRQDGETRVQPILSSSEWQTFLLPNGGFSADKLLSAAASETGLVVNTALGTFPLSRSSSLIGPISKPIPLPPEPDRLHVRHHQGNSYLFAGDGQHERLWDNRTLSWLSVTGDRYVHNREAASIAGLRIGLTDGRWRTEVEMEQIADGESGFRSFDWQKGEHFPFDSATSVYGLSSGVVAVGTRFGLRILDGTRDELLTISTNDRPEVIERIGRPYDEPDTIMTRSRSGCARLESRRWSKCTNPERLDHLALGETSYWRWSWKDGVEGRYLTPTNTPIGPAIQEALPMRFPHDTLDDLVACDGKSFALRNDGLTERYGDETGNPLMSSGLWVTPENMRGRLYCLRFPVHLEEGVLAPGLFLISGSVVHRFNVSGWARLHNDIHVSTVRAFDRGDFLPDWGRLRAIRPERADWRIEHRTQMDRWEPLSWARGRLEMDVLSGPATVTHGRLWVSTPAGLVSYNQSGRLEIDPFAFMIVDPGKDRENACKIERIATLQGRAAYAPSSPTEPTQLRCADGRIFEGVLDSAAEQNGLNQIEEDPFAVREAIQQLQGEKSDQRVVWRIVAPARVTPSLQIVFKGEENSLIAGRLATDDLLGLAVFKDGSTEQVSSLGWHRTDAALSVAALHRPGGTDVRVDEIIDLFLTSDDYSKPTNLCLVRRDNSSVQIGPDGQRTQDRRCEEYIGYDGFWTYRRADGQVKVTASAINGPLLVRHLVDGKFTDLWAESLPVSITSEAGKGLYVPTRVGVSIFDQEGRLKNVFVVDGNTGGMTVLEGRPFYLGLRGSGAPLGGPMPFCTKLVEILQTAPEHLKIQLINSAGGDTWDFLLDDNGRRLQERFHCATGSETFMPWLVSTRVGQRPGFQANAVDWPEAGPELFAWLDEEVLKLYDGQRTELSLSVPLDAPPRRLILTANRLFLLTENDLYGGEIDALVRDLHENGRVTIIQDSIHN